jgi:integrase/recombinase XerD
MYSPLLGVLAATGLRIAEALGLCCQDVTPDGLVMRETTCRKSRFGPLHPTPRAALEESLVKHTHLTTDDAHRFVSLRHRPLRRTTVYPTFRRLLAAAGVPRTPGRAPPRLIDGRHTFASKVLLPSPAGRAHLGRHLLALTTSLGHAHVSCTCWYLERAPQLRDDSAQACERFVEEHTP